MKAMVRAQYGPHVLQFAEVEKPIPKNGEVLVKLWSASVNPVELYRMRGASLIRLLSTPKPKVLGCDISGRVERLAGAYISFSRATRCLG